MAITNTLPGWVNSDGLRVKFAAEEKVLGTGGTFATQIGHQKVTEFDVDYATVALGTDASNVVILDYDVILPNGAIIDKIEFQVGAAWDSVSSDVTINFGVVKRSDFTTIVDADGLAASITKAALDTPNALVQIYNEGSATFAGALLDDAAGLAFDSVVCAFWAAHVPTSGTGKLRIYWRG